MCVYGMIPRNISTFSNFTADYLFYIDGQRVGNYSYPSTESSGGGPSWQNNSQVLYSNPNLSKAQHTFVLQNGRDEGGPSTIFFDYLIYST